MTARLDGKIALVTGAGGDVGRAVVTLMIARGARVIGLDIDAAALAAVGAILPNEAAWWPLTADVTKEQDVAEAVAATITEFGRADILINNAGVEGGALSAWRLSTEVARADFDHVFAVNVTGTFLCMKYVIPEMVKAGGGSIVNVSSIAGLRPPAGQIAYAASKAAVVGMTRTAALEWSERGVRVNCIAPGSLQGRMMEAIAEQMAEQLGQEPAGLRDRLIPMGRWGHAAEVAEVVAFVASDDARFYHRGDLSDRRRNGGMTRDAAGSFAGKVALITGAAGDVGAAAGAAFCRTGRRGCCGRSQCTGVGQPPRRDAGRCGPSDGGLKRD